MDKAYKKTLRIMDQLEGERMFTLTQLKALLETEIENRMLSRPAKEMPPIHRRSERVFKRSVALRAKENHAMNSTAETGGSRAVKVAKAGEIHKVIEAALKQLEEHAGEEGFRHPFDKAVHVLVSLDQAGFHIVRKPSRR